jgi:hypothetical protein
VYRPVRLEEDGAVPAKRKKKRPQGLTGEEKEGGEGRKKVKKKEGGGEGDRMKLPKKVKAKGEPPTADRGADTADGRKEKVKQKKEKAEGAPEKVVKKRVTKDGGKEGLAADENAALALPAGTASPLPQAEQAGAPAGTEESKGGEGGGVHKRGGKKALLADKVKLALQVSKDRENAQLAARKEAEAKKAAKKSESKKGKKAGGEGESSAWAADAPRPERTENLGSILSATVSGVPIGLLNAEVSNARTLGSRPDSKKRPRADDDSRTETEETAPVKKIKSERSEGGREEGPAAKPRKPRPTDSERLEAAIAELKVSVAELCPPETEREAEAAAGGEEEGEEGAKKKRLPGPTQAALSKVARVAGMRKVSAGPCHPAGAQLLWEA